MADRHSAGHWAGFNAQQAGRQVRSLCRAVIESAGPAAGRTAIDLGCGAGIETRALLEAGWRVLALDGEPDTRARLLRTIGGRHDRLTIRPERFDEVTELPEAALIYAGYSLPYQPRGQFGRVWTLLRAALQPGGLLAVNLFGERDAWAGDDGMTFLSVTEARELLTGLRIEHWFEEDELGTAYSGPKHWHVFDVIARRARS